MESQGHYMETFGCLLVFHLSIDLFNYLLLINIYIYIYIFFILSNFNFCYNYFFIAFFINIDTYTKCKVILVNNNVYNRTREKTTKKTTVLKLIVFFLHIAVSKSHNYINHYKGTPVHPATTNMVQWAYVCWNYETRRHACLHSICTQKHKSLTDGGISTPQFKQPFPDCHNCRQRYRLIISTLMLLVILALIHWPNLLIIIK